MKTNRGHRGREEIKDSIEMEGSETKIRLDELSFVWLNANCKELVTLMLRSACTLVSFAFSSTTSYT